MAIKLVKTFKQSQILAMTPSLRKSIELLQLSKFELLEEIKHHHDENPFIKNINEIKEFDTFNFIRDLKSFDTLKSRATCRKIVNYWIDLNINFFCY